MALRTPTRPDSDRDIRRTLATPSARSVVAGAAMAALLAAGFWSLASLKINVATIVDSVGNATDFLSRTLPLDFPAAGEAARLCGETLAIVVCATLLAVVLSLPIAVLAARNTTPNPGIRYGARALVVVARAVPDVVLAIVFFRIFGLGSLTGVLAMGLHSVGMIGKLYADSVEQIDEGPRTAIRATGVGRLQELVTGVVPQVAPAFVATALHRFDINLRVSVVLGFVGVGGIGFEIAQSLRELDYPRAMALALIVVLLCVAVELISGVIRRALLGGPTGQRRKPRRMPQHRNRAVEPGRISPPWDAARIRRAGFLALAVAIVIASAWEAELSPSQVVDGLRDIGTTAGLFWPPETGGIGAELFDELLVTIKIALAGTLIGAVLALPVGAMAARNVAPSPRVATVFRIFVVFVRGVPELILAIVLVVITGLGPVAGACALGIGAMGLLGKLVADSLEETDTRVQLALRATGASGTQVFFAATLPQAAPAFVAHILYQLDVNIRAATLLGIVGAGGIGFYLLNASRVLEFGVVTTVMLMVFVTVLAVELLALWLRRVVS